MRNTFIAKVIYSVKNCLLSSSGPDHVHVQVMSRSCPGHLIPISISNLKVWTWSWLYNCNATHHHHHHQETFLSEITQISLQKVNHWHKVRFRETSEYAHWPTETLVPWSPWSPLVTRHTGRLSQRPVVKMSWEEKSKKKPSVLTNFLSQDLQQEYSQDVL